MRMQTTIDRFLDRCVGRCASSNLFSLWKYEWFWVFQM